MRRLAALVLGIWAFSAWGLEAHYSNPATREIVRGEAVEGGILVLTLCGDPLLIATDRAGAQIYMGVPMNEAAMAYDGERAGFLELTAVYPQLRGGCAGAEPSGRPMAPEPDLRPAGFTFAR